MSKSRTIRVVFPEWQGGQIPSYNLGSQLLEFLAPNFNGETIRIPVNPPEDAGEEDTRTIQGIDGHDAVLKHLRIAKKLISAHYPDRIVVIGGDCSTMVAPFHFLSKRYGDEFGLLWLDAHPDLWDGTNNSHYNAMTISALLGECSPAINREITHPIGLEKVHWVGLRSELNDAIRHLPIALTQSTPASDANVSSKSIINWIHEKGISKLAIHFDLDVLDPNQFTLTAVPEAEGLRLETIARLCKDLSEVVDIVGFGVAEHAPKQLLNLRNLLEELPLFKG